MKTIKREIYLEPEESVYKSRFNSNEVFNDLGEFSEGFERIENIKETIGHTIGIRLDQLFRS